LAGFELDHRENFQNPEGLERLHEYARDYDLMKTSKIPKDLSVCTSTPEITISLSRGPATTTATTKRIARAKTPRSQRCSRASWSRRQAMSPPTRRTMPRSQQRARR
jgi:hypothetical protein